MGVERHGRKVELMKPIRVLSLTLGCIAALASAQHIDAKCDKKKAEQTITSAVKSGVYSRVENYNGTVAYEILIPWDSLGKPAQEQFVTEALENERCIKGKGVAVQVSYKGKEVAWGDVFGGVVLSSVENEEIVEDNGPLPDFKLTQTHTIPGIKISFDCILSNPVSRPMLKRLYEKIAKDYNTASYKRVFIMWYLPHYKIGAGAWGTTNSEDGKVEVRILKLQG